MSDNVIITKPE